HRNFSQQQRKWDIFAAKNVAFANPAPPQRRQMSACLIIDVHNIQSRLDIDRDFSGRRGDNDLAGWRGPHVTRSDWGGWIDDDRREALFPDHIDNQLFGDDLALLVRSDRTLDRQT